MAITDFTSYGAMQAGPNNIVQLTKANNTSAVGKPSSLWTTGPNNGAAPTTAVAPDNTTTGAMRGFQAGGSNPLRLVRAQFSGTAISGTQPNTLMLCDRLSHQGGLSGTTTGAQTTNLPTAALTRYTSGEGVFAALEIYTAIGTTATTVTASYTNTGSTSGRTTIATDIGAAANNAVSRLIILPLQQGDTGVKSVESVTLAASTVSAAGNFGVTLFKPLAIFPLPQSFGYVQDFDPFLNLAANMPEYLDNACLFWVQLSGGTTSGTFQGNLWFSEDQ